jgi:hypothetical protein
VLFSCYNLEYILFLKIKNFIHRIKWIIHKKPSLRSFLTLLFHLQYSLWKMANYLLLFIWHNVFHFGILLDEIGLMSHLYHSFFPTTILCAFLITPTCAAYQTHCTPSFHHSNNVWWRLKINPDFYFSPISHYWLSYQLTYSLELSLLKYLHSLHFL